MDSFDALDAELLFSYCSTNASQALQVAFGVAALIPIRFLNEDQSLPLIQSQRLHRDAEQARDRAYRIKGRMT